MEKRKLLIIGAGPAGISAAITAKNNSFQDILILDRLPKPGGILPQCYHRGFEHAQRRSKLTGPEYTELLLKDLGDPIEIRTDSTVTKIAREGFVTVAGSDGVYRLSADAIILATGCRERSIGSLPIYGSRPAGVFTAGSVQKMMNLSGYRIGSRAVILGSGDVGMIVAHHLAESGVEVLAVIEKEQQAGGLVRNKRQYLDTHGIPLLTKHIITKLHGDHRLEAVTVCRVENNKKPVPTAEYRLECDILISSVGLIPELELIRDLHVNIDKLNLSGSAVTTAVPWLFVCGNARRVHSLVGSVIAEGITAGNLALRYLAEHKEFHL